MKKEKIVNGFTQLSNAFIFDASISFKAKGIFSLMVSRPPNWKFNVNELASNSNKDGMNALRSGLKELRLAGYILLKKEYDRESKQLKGARYTLTDKHLIKNENNRDAEKLNVGKPEILKSRGSKELEIMNPEGQLKPMLNNKENSNTDFNKKTQQQTHSYNNHRSWSY